MPKKTVKKDAHPFPFPEVAYAEMEKEIDGEPYPVFWADWQDASVEGSGQGFVGVYELIGVRQLKVTPAKKRLV